MLKNIYEWIIRQIALRKEISFWDHWFKYEGVTEQLMASARHKDYLHRLNPQSEFQEKFRQLINLPPDSSIHILDIGAGPVTIIGKCWDERDIILQCVDMLAKYYDKLLAKYKITPPIRTIYANAERLTDIFNENTFDFVYARNALDHTNNPVQAIQEALLVVKPNCFVMMEHLVNEGSKQKYRGLHKWNFFEKKGNFMISNEITIINISHELKHLAEIECKVENNSNWIITTLKKRASVQ